ncbi:MAG: tetraacyldisaccharide 4-kinase [Alphaproteobacteria bacterium]|nr:tetraacyldisaccharide 4-kinase [Alphaproteobacteria bacterium]
MREPSFWWRGVGVEALALAPFAAAYGAVAAYRMERRGHVPGVPVICIGNLTVGGAGKTPTALALARLLINGGRRVVFLSRGYGGEAAGPLRVDAARHSAAEVGDEPLLLARLAPTIVAHDRVAGAEMARAAGASTIVMDDGFQNPSLIKNLSIVVIDTDRGIGNGYVIPAGPLRAPLHAQMRHAHALLVLGAPSSRCESVIAEAQARNLPILYGQLEVEADAVSALAGLRVLAFAGIGNPGKFFSTAAAAGISVQVTEAFPDHHRYSRYEAEALLKRAAREDLVLLTTEKDLVRIARDPELATLAKVTRALPVALEIEDDEPLRQLLFQKAF